MRTVNIHRIHRLLSNAVVSHNHGQSFNIYGLQYGLYHHVVLKNEDALWDLMQNKHFLQAQYDCSQNPMSIRDGDGDTIAHYVMQHGVTPQNDGRLAALTLRSGELWKHAFRGIESH